MPFVDLNPSGGISAQVKAAGRILYSFEARKRLAALLASNKIDIAHLHNIHHQLSPSILHELKKHNIPIVMTLHDYKMACPVYTLLANGSICEACGERNFYHVAQKRCVKGSYAKSILSAIEMYLHHSMLDIYRLVDIFIAPSQFLKDKLADMGFNKKIVHLANFVDVSEMSGFNDQRSSTHGIVYFGRLSAEKGLSTLLRAVATLPNVKLDVIGDGPQRTELEEWALRYCKDRVSFQGYLSGDALWSTIKKATAVVVPSEWYENNPMSIIEAFALGIPVIGSRIGGIPELVRDRETGYTFEAGNASDLANKIQLCLSSPGETRCLGANAYNWVRCELNPQRHYEQLMTIYDEAKLTNSR